MRFALRSVLLALYAVGCARDSNLVEPEAGRGGAGAGGTAGSVEAGAAEPEAGAGAGGGGAGGSGGASGDIAPGPLDAIQLLESSCTRLVQPTELLPANILFVLDRSASMVCNPPPTTDSAVCEREAKRATADPSKWEITQNAVAESLMILPDASRVGVSYFSNDDACGVQATPSVPIYPNSTPQKERIKTSLSRAKPGGATPLVGATILAYQHVYEAARAGSFNSNNFVVLITDGKQSDACGDPDRCDSADECTELLIEQEVPKAAGPGVRIRTFVIGVPGSELDKRTLSRIAIAGGTARAPNCDADRDCHFDVSGVTDLRGGLRTALQNIVGQTLSCDLPAPRPDSSDRNLVNVLYLSRSGVPQLIRQDTQPCDSGANGWQYADDDRRIRLCGEACSMVKSDPEGQLQVLIGCPIQGPE